MQGGVTQNSGQNERSAERFLVPIGKLNNVMLYLSDGVKSTPFSGSFSEWNDPFFGLALSSVWCKCAESIYSAFQMFSYALIFINRGKRSESRSFALSVAFVVYF